MGISYVNITLKGPSQYEVAYVLAILGRNAWITPAVGDITVVYDSEITSGSDTLLAMALAESLSATMNCVAFVSYVFDSDIFIYALYSGGEELDYYDSRPDYGSLYSDRPPAGGDAAKLCSVFGIDVPRRLTSDCTLVMIDRILQRGRTQEEEDGVSAKWLPYVFEDYRHIDLLHALGLPSFIAYSGYEKFAKGSFLKEIKETDMMKV